nr:hypothetical protein [Caldimonas sp.]
MSASAAAVPSPAPPLARLARGVPALVELALVAAAIAWLVPLFARIAPLDPGRDQRFLDRGIAVVGLPDPVLPATCDAVAALAAPDVAGTLCGSRLVSASTRKLDAIPAPLALAIGRATEAFARPLRAADERARSLAGSDPDGDAAVRERADAIAAIESDVAPFVERFQLAPGAGPLPLRCAARWVESSLARPARAEPARGDAEARANAVLLLAAALDGRAAAAALAATAELPPAPRNASCANGGEALAATAALLADARHSLDNARKNEAMRALGRDAGTQWPAAMA